ncbi:MAG: acyl-CoA dehydratase activase [Treponema sp.]|nr:acyl-CoA dehydratase activase [Treponema sp.]
MQSLGINIGSTSLKIVLLDGKNILWSTVGSHEGNLAATVQRLFSDRTVPEGIPTLITGNEGRLVFDSASTVEPLCVEAAINHLNLKADALVSMGGEDLIVYKLNPQGKIINSFSGNKCASGTGEFLRQQLARMDMTFADIDKISDNAHVYPLSTRCSVFMKSDCTHRLNKHEATKEDIVLSLSDVMAVKVIDFLKRAKIEKGTVVLTGGITLNRHIIRFIREKAPAINICIPESAPFFEALGAAVLAQKSGTPLPSLNKLLKPYAVRFGSLGALSAWKDSVTVFSKAVGTVQKGRSYILGVDGGSTTTKACLVDTDTDEIVASHYGRTHGDPIKALKECLSVIQQKIVSDTGEPSCTIVLVATTGSSREILGVFLETPGVYNEIIAHAVGTTYFDPSVETIFEIGGQDAKYVLLKNGVPIDYAMNEACSAGTGSFLEESASGDLAIHTAAEIGPIALDADAPCKFGEHCSAFINSDIRKAVQQGATKENITAGLACSIVANYLNRVVGNRTIGAKIFLQGGVAKNPAVPLAFAMLLNKEILVPPSPELTGCFGVALLAKRKQKDGFLAEQSVHIPELIHRDIQYERIFKCKACENLCPIQVLNVNGTPYMFGGRCNKYTNTRKTIREDIPVFDYVEKREFLLFEQYAAPVLESKKRDFTVGIPRAFSVHTLYPLYSWFFYTLGIKTFLSTDVVHAGIARAESAYCFPAEIAHGAVQDCVDKGADYIFLPHFRDMPSYQPDVHANFCPITQSFPYYIEKAFLDVDKKKWLPCVISFKFGKEKTLELFCSAMEKIGIKPSETEQAFNAAMKKQEEYWAAIKTLATEALAEARAAKRPVIALLGRPYNAFTREANMGIPRKFTTRGYSVIPFDILPFEQETIFPNMYWYYGQQDIKSAAFLKKEDNIYITWISNFSCAPDSFLLHYLKWIMGTKPFLVLELDSHSADAGIDTRIEAFLDIIDGYRAEKDSVEAERYSNGWRFVYEADEEGKEDFRLVNDKSGEQVAVRHNPRVKVLLSNMGAISTEYIGAAVRSIGIQAEALPVATAQTLQVARAHASGKECVPSHLVLGGALQYFASDKYRKDELYLLFVPITTGPCRTGQYYVYYENLFRDLRLENVCIFILSADNSYTELGPNFAKEMWKGFVLADYLKDIQTALQATAEDPVQAVQDFEHIWRRLMDVVEYKPKRLWKELEQAAEEIKKIPLHRAVSACPKVLVVGEIYVRRDDFAVGELIDLISERGIVVKIAGISEWIHYLDVVREYALKKLIHLEKPALRLLSKPFRALKKLELEMWWKHDIEKKVLSILEPTGLIVETPHDMHQIMEVCQKYFVNLELNSEIAVSSGVAATALEYAQYSGVVNISPFACLIGRVIEGLLVPWTREHNNYPVLSVEVDGNVLPPNIINKLNIFMVNVLRFRGDSTVQLIDTPQQSHCVEDTCSKQTL